jgi:hypothetical protein
MLGTVYQYDQLNRLISGNAYQQTFDEATGQWTAAGETAMYNNQFTYDANDAALSIP